MGLGQCTFATKSIISKGLHLDKATKGMLTSRFHIYVTEKCLRRKQDGGGGPYPGPAWNKIDSAQNFYKPVEPPYYVPLEKEHELFIRKINVCIQLRIGDSLYEKIYVVDEKWKNAVVSVADLTNTTYDKMSAIATNIRRITTRAKVSATNLVPKAERT